MGWATACDLRYATPRSRWSTAFLTVGVSGDMGLVWNLTRLLGPTKARELLLFPERFGGDDPEMASGLVQSFYEALEIREPSARGGQTPALAPDRAP